MTEMQNATPTPYTDEQKKTVKTAAMGAIALVTAADPGLLAALKESWAGSQVLAKAPESIREILQDGGFPTPPQASDAAEREQAILEELREATQILQANPTDLEAFRAVMTEAMEATANASKGVAPAESEVMQKMQAALNG
ncbi:hypothetical protein SAMN05445756_1821 [Kytococcus aerolatus]|uniref:Uncharacterized protein n=1 Tax=Kytococcus aerolatus TaxID=592308 RepID=A0A212U2M3_9MICO|nr:hypothetical protein [Kytococcus aerolatus]SNC72371.1 hypothetical protein SAMN05445756_1821 [Kytococcus aerolatus]